MIKFIIIFIVIIILTIIIIFSQSTPNQIINFVLKHFNTKIKVYGKKNLKNYNNLKLIIMSNHHSALDQSIITHVINSNIVNNKKIYTIVKHNLFGDENDKNYISNILGYFKDPLYSFFNFIPYIRGNKNSGLKIKRKIQEILNKKNSLLLFPEGETTKKAIPKNFKPGSFKLCAENNIGILPISLKFDKCIGGNRRDTVEISKWYNANVIVYIHEPIFDNDWEKLSENVMNKIKEPLV